jgi:acid-sensing ion channel, other
MHTISGEIPRVSKQFFRVPLRQEVVVSVKPNMITTSEGLVGKDWNYHQFSEIKNFVITLGYAPDRRQCYFNDERNLKFFKVYTQSNCELECLANYTLGKNIQNFFSFKFTNYLSYDCVLKPNAVV